MDKEVKNKRQRERRALNGNAETKKYERTKSGFLVRKYRNMLSRVSGVQKHKHHLYLGLEIIDKQDFYKWALSCSEFHDMFEEYVNSDYNRKVCLTVDRIDSTKGYVIGNMQWLTHSENSRKGTFSRFGIV